MNRKLPKISIVTPSLNQGKYIEQTILSVIGQNYDNLEYIIIDGGSTDNTIEIIKKYQKYLAYWISEPDNGQAQAINKGFSLATGDIFGWINSDDYLLPGILKKISSLISPAENQFISGNVFHYVEQTRLAWCGYSHERRYQFDHVLDVTQPGSFWTKKAWLLCNGLNENCHFTFDWELLIKARQANVSFIRTEDYLAVYRMHENHKSSTGGEKRQKEIYNIYKQYHSEDEAQFYIFVCNHASEINWVIKKFKRFRLNRFRNLALLIRYYKISKKYKFQWNNIECYLEML